MNKIFLKESSIDAGKVKEVWLSYWLSIGEKRKVEKKSTKFPFAVKSEKWQKFLEAEEAEKMLRGKVGKRVKRKGDKEN